MIIILYGVYINASDKARAMKLQRVCETFLKVWKDSGPIDMPEEDIMKIPLVEGW